MEEHVRQRKGKAGVAAKGYSTVRVHCHSQMHAEGFYAKAGYLRQGEQFMEVRPLETIPAPLCELTSDFQDGAPHCLLIKDLELDAI